MFDRASIVPHKCPMVKKANKNGRGRPKLGKVKHRLSFTPKASKIAQRRACELGVDFSDYIEHLVRQANPTEFPIGIFGGRAA